MTRKYALSIALACTPACGSTTPPADLRASGDSDAAPISDAAHISDAATNSDAAVQNPALAFPGAVGWAAHTPGGRGGQIVRVTTLAANGPGSLAAALAVQSPRIVVFEVGGVINLARARLQIRSPFVTIAGQTAPSPGITIIQGGLTIYTHDVVLQHIRVRPGEAGMAKMSGWEVDALSTSDGAYDVIVDHCSTTWATDENLSASGSRFSGATPDEWRAATSHRITFSYNIVAEGLSNSTHSKGEHSKGGLIHDNVTDMAIVKNLYFSNMERNPLFKGGARGIVVNNLVGNPGRWAMMYGLVATEWGDHPYETGQMSIVGNVVLPGPSTPADTPLLRVSGAGLVDVYFEDNSAKTAAGADMTLVGGTSAANALTVEARPTWPDGFEAAPASSVAEDIRANVGARPWDRDAIDARIVEQALAGQGDIIDSEQEVGGYPILPATSAPFNPDEWDLATMTRK